MEEVLNEFEQLLIPLTFERPFIAPHPPVVIRSDTSMMLQVLTSYPITTRTTIVAEWKSTNWTGFGVTNVPSVDRHQFLDNGTLPVWMWGSDRYTFSQGEQQLSGQPLLPATVKMVIDPQRCSIQFGEPAVLELKLKGCTPGAPLYPVGCLCTAQDSLTFKFEGKKTTTSKQVIKK